MKNYQQLFFFCILFFFVVSCHRKTVPSQGRTTVIVTTKENSSSSSGSTPSSNTSTTTKTKAARPTVITVNDNVAKKTVDGRYYYDLNGKRYWKNYKDGKYYLYNKSMYNNPDFKAP